MNFTENELLVLTLVVKDSRNLKGLTSETLKILDSILIKVGDELKKRVEYQVNDEIKS